MWAVCKKELQNYFYSPIGYVFIAILLKLKHKISLIYKQIYNGCYRHKMAHKHSFWTNNILIDSKGEIYSWNTLD